MVFTLGLCWKFCKICILSPCEVGPYKYGLNARNITSKYNNIHCLKVCTCGNSCLMNFNEHSRFSFSLSMKIK